MAKYFGFILLLAILTGICEAQAEGPNLWATEIAYDKKVPGPTVPIYINDRLQGQGNLLVLHYQVSTQRGWSWPAVLTLSTSGYIQLVPATNPPTNFGSSAVLGPGYWSKGVYHHNPTLQEIRLSGEMRTATELSLAAIGSLGDLATEYELKIQPPTDKGMVCWVRQKAVSQKEFALDGERLYQHEGWKLVQLSSMFVDANSYKADLVHFLGRLAYHQAVLSNTAGFVFNPTDRLSGKWLEIAVWEKTNQNLPSLSVELEDIALTRNCSPQGWVAESNDPDFDNVAVWIHWDAVPLQWSRGQSQEIKYWLMARDKPRMR